MAIQRNGHNLHEDVYGNDIKLLTILHSNIARDAIRNFTVSYEGQPLRCFLCRGVTGPWIAPPRVPAAMG